MTEKRIGESIGRVGFVSTRVAGTDGVSLEIAKWAHVLEEMGIQCYYITGESDRPTGRTALIEEAHFEHPEVLEISQQAFGGERRSPAVTAKIVELSQKINRQLRDAVEEFRLDSIVAENALTIPMNIPLGVAIVSEVQETGIGCVAHHHDFFWERDRFLVNSVDDFLTYAFPPSLGQIRHFVINSQAANDFCRRTGQSCRVIPNVMDFQNPPPEADDYARSFRKEIGIEDGEWLILQPTRVVPRKGIEHAIELCRRLDPGRAKLVITHKSGDEGGEYKERLVEFAELLGVDLRFVDDRIAEERGTDADGRLLFTLEDTFSQADLVAYPSEYEGFGNAFLEAIYYRRPVVCNRYSIYRTDIEPCGFHSVLFDGFLTKACVAEAKRVLTDADFRREMVEHNYEVALNFFSYDVLRAEFEMLMKRPHSVYRFQARNPKYRDPHRPADRAEVPTSFES